MKKRLFWAFGVLCVVALSLASCQKEDDGFDETLLIGKWQCGTEYYRYDATYSDFTRYNGNVVRVNGCTWDTKDDVSEDEAQPFTWTLEKSTLTQIHIMEMGGNVPKVYTVTKLTSTTLCYEDNYGKSYTFTKVN